MDTEKLRELEMGQDVKVITTGDFQLIDVANGLLFPPRTECDCKLTTFVMDQLELGNLTLAGEDDAPKAKKSKSEDDLRYDEASRAEKDEDKGAEKQKAESNSSTGNEAMTSETVAKPKAKSPKPKSSDE
jgi:hypothetical protein